MPLAKSVFSGIAEIIAQTAEQIEIREFNRQLFVKLCIQSAVTFEKCLRSQP
jgi:hypothetical protein